MQGEKSMDKQTQEQLEAFFTKKLEEQYRRGVAVGFKTACKAVLDTLNDGSKPLMGRIGAVKKFCSTPFKMANSEKKTDEVEAVKDEDVNTEEMIVEDVKVTDTVEDVEISENTDETAE